MNARAMTLEEVRRKGIEAVKREIGSVGMVRFLQQFETGEGDYSKERHETLHGLSVETVAAEIRSRRDA